MTALETALARIERQSSEIVKLRSVLGALRNECSGTPRPARLVGLLSDADAVLAVKP